MKLKKILSLILAVSVVTSMAGCSSNSTSKKGEEKDNKSEAKVITAMIAGKLDPTLCSPTETSADFRLYEMIYEPLVRYGEGGNIEPGLAESWSISEDGKEFTFKLKKDVKFSDGSDFNADSVIFSAQKWKADSFSSKMTEAKKVDDYTVKISFEHSCYPCLTELSYPRPYRIAGKASYDDQGNFKEMIGTGPWMVESFKADQEVVLVQNPNYYGEKPKVDKVILKRVTDGQSRVMALQNGEADISISDIPEDSNDAIKSNKDLTSLSTEGTNSYFLMLNENNKFLKDVKIRQALNYAIDKDSIINNILNGKGKAATGLLPDITPYVNEKNSEGYKYNLDKAKELIKSAGFSDSDGDGIVERDGEKLAFKLVFQTEEYASWKTVCEFLQSEYAKIGVEITLELRESAAYYDAIWKNRNFDMIMYRTYEDSWNPHGFMKAMFAYDKDSNGICWSDEALSESMKEVVKIQDEEIRQAKYDEIFKTLNDNAYTVPLYYPVFEYIYNNRLTNVEKASTSYEAIKWSLVDKK